jgi:flagellar basal body rod protein FlgB
VFVERRVGVVLSSSIASGLTAMQSKMDAHANNIANARTSGYKRLVPRTSERPQGGVDVSVARENEDLSEVESRLAPEAGSSQESSESSVDTSSADPSSIENSLAARSALAPDNDVDLVEEQLGMNEALRMTEALVSAYRRESEALGSLFDAFG